MATFWISWEVRKPSKKLMKGTRPLIMAKPVWRQAITSEWSPKMFRDWAATVRADTWKTPGNSSPAILYILGIISNRPWEAV